MGETALSDLLAMDPPLRILKLASNRLNDNDAKSIASALRHNTNLREFYLEENHISLAGKMSIHYAIYDLEFERSIRWESHLLHL